MIDRAALLIQEPRAQELLQYLDAMPPEGVMNNEGIEKILELVRIYERCYLDDFIKKHPDDFPAKAAMAFTGLYEKGLPAVTDLESLTIPTNLKNFQIMEFKTAMILKGSGCSERLIADFLGRNRETVRKYLTPLNKAVEDSLQLSPTERDAVVLPVINNIMRELSGKTGAV